MYRLTRNLRTLAFLAVIAAVLAGVGALWWANHTGLPAAWRAAIERHVAKQGAHVKIGSLRYAIFQGIIATDVRVYSEAEHLREISRLERVILDFDKTKLARGKLHLYKIQLDHARLTMPVDPQNPDSETLHVLDANGTVFMHGDRRLEVRGARGKIAGIDVTLDARIIGYQQDGKKPPDDSHIRRRRELLAKVIGELGKWQFNEKKPPSIRITVEGNINERSSLIAKLALHVHDMEKNGHVIDEVTATADLAGDLVTVTSLRASDPRGVFEGHIDYNIQDREGRFDVTSSLEVPELLSAWLGLPSPMDVEIRGRQFLDAGGSFHLDDQNRPQIRMTGHARCEALSLRGIAFKAVEGAFSWRDGNLFLRDVRIIRDDGKAEGKAMVEWPLIRLELHSTLPAPVYRPFFTNQPLGIVINDFSEREGAAVDFRLEGGFDASDRNAWAYTGSGTFKNLNYKGVPLNAAGCQFSLNHQELDFHDGTVVFNYSNYALRDAFDGAAEGTAKVGRIRFDAPSKIVEIEDVRGAIWAAPVVRIFAPKVADSLEQYRFHEPPDLKASGVVDVTQQGRTVLDVTFSSEQPADFQFLGKNLTLGEPRGQVAIRGPKVAVSNLKLIAFDGPVVGRIDYPGGGRLGGELSWTQLSLPDLTSAYGFQMKGGGTVTGRIEFALADGKVETMAGKGLLALEKAELFSVPMFGPLTPLVSGVLNDERAGFQRAKAAFCTFTIQDGILRSNDFQTSTSSLNFAGDGSVDLAQRTLDMNMRLNARGLLGLITLPLRPFSGLFQFHGSGPLKDTRWESMKFTAPPESQREILLEPPRATVVPDSP